MQVYLMQSRLLRCLDIKIHKTMQRELTTPFPERKHHNVYVHEEWRNPESCYHYYLHFFSSQKAPTELHLMKV